jgi:hypothetical protein
MDNYPFGFGEADLERMYPDPADPKPCSGCMWFVPYTMKDGRDGWMCTNAERNGGYAIEVDADELSEGCWED